MDYSVSSLFFKKIPSDPIDNFVKGQGLTPLMKLEIDVPDSAFSALRQAPKEFIACLQLMAAIKLYEIGHLSQERAAELAGQCRQEFLVSLSRLGVSPFQGVEDDLATLALLP